MYRQFRMRATLLASMLVFPTLAAAQAAPLQTAQPSAEKRALTLDGVPRWRNVQNPVISADGGWVARVYEHHLRGAPAAPWLLEGERFIDKRRRAPVRLTLPQTTTAEITTVPQLDNGAAAARRGGSQPCVGRARGHWRRRGRAARIAGS